MNVLIKTRPCSKLSRVKTNNHENSNELCAKKRNRTYKTFYLVFKFNVKFKFLQYFYDSNASINCDLFTIKAVPISLFISSVIIISISE